MYSKLHSLIGITLGLALGVAGAAQAQGQTPAAVPAQAPAAGATATIHGRITDPTGALIPGATITVSTAGAASVRMVTANAGGAAGAVGA